MLWDILFGLTDQRAKDKNWAFAFVYDLVKGQIPGNSVKFQVIRCFFYFVKFPQKSLKKTYLTLNRIELLEEQ